MRQIDGLDGASMRINTGEYGASVLDDRHKDAHAVCRRGGEALHAGHPRSNAPEVSYLLDAEQRGWESKAIER